MCVGVYVAALVCARQNRFNPPIQGKVTDARSRFDLGYFIHNLKLTFVYIISKDIHCVGNRL